VGSRRHHAAVDPEIGLQIRAVTPQQMVGEHAGLREVPLTWLATVQVFGMPPAVELAAIDIAGRREVIIPRAAKVRDLVPTLAIIVDDGELGGPLFVFATRGCQRSDPQTTSSSAPFI